MAEAAPFSYSQSCTPNRTLIKQVIGRDDQGVGLHGKEVTVAGWVRSGRLAEKNTLAFIALNDGSGSEVLQVIISKDIYTAGPLNQLAATGSCIAVKGTLAAPPETATGQKTELKATEILHVGLCDASKYPLAKKAHSLEFLRANAHLRSRTNLLSCVFRVRNSLAFATHKFFQERHFYYLHTPLITSSDCEGAGEMFQVTTLLPKDGEVVPTTSSRDPEKIEQATKAASAQGSVVAQLKKDKASKEEITAAVGVLQEKKEEIKRLESEPYRVGGVPHKESGCVDYSLDFFRTPSYLTVSGQLQGEDFACSMSNIYTFGPTFRAENSHTSRHLAEFWMIEPEVAFADLVDNMNLAEDYVKFCCKYVLENNLADLEAIDKYHAFAASQAAKGQKKQKGAKGAAAQRVADEPCVERLKKVSTAAFKRVSYTEAVDVLLASGKKFTKPVKWGVDLASEHERYLAEEAYKLPTIVYNYPKDIKAFYMRENEDGKTVAAMDVLCPQIGELIGGSQREEREDKLVARIQELNLKEEDFSAYLDLRRYGTCPHSGFGLGFERLVLFATGIENIRDVIPYPRAPNTPL